VWNRPPIRSLTASCPAVRKLNDVRNTLETWRQEYNWERPYSSLAYRTPAEFGRVAGFGNVQAKNASHISTAKNGGRESISKPTPKTESLVMNG